MAKVGGLIGVVGVCCVLLLALIGQSDSVGLQESSQYFYNYNGPLSSSEFTHIELLHSRQRRQSPLTKSDAPASVPTKPKPEPVVSDKAPLLVINAGLDGTQLSADEVTTVKPAPKLEQRLLGVNGTGQRKDVLLPSTDKPTLVSEPINTGDKATYDVINSIDVPSNDTADKIEAAKHNYTITTRDFQFYNSTSKIDAAATNATWTAINNMSANGVLSKSHRRAITVQLSFEFPFYGHAVRNITVATGGFLYTGEYVHSWLAATQYIAPLMANFDTSISADSFVKLYDNGTTFTVLWENVSLQDVSNAGNFTFSVTLHKTGKIVFNYFSLPVEVETILDDKHPVKIGLSDAYIIDKTIVLARRKTIYEYHRVNFESQDITNNTIIELTLNPTCHSLTECAKCTTELVGSFNCSWCPILNKCSTGTDRKRQEWLQKGCDKVQISDASACPAIGTKGNNYGAEQTFDVVPPVVFPGSSATAPSSPATPAAAAGLGGQSVINNSPQPFVVGASDIDDDVAGINLAFSVFLPIVLVMALTMWVLYAYRNPHTKSGQLLIQYRPSQWSWRRGEARYTAATIHM